MDPRVQVEVVGAVGIIGELVWKVFHVCVGLQTVHQQAVHSFEGSCMIGDGAKRKHGSSFQEVWSSTCSHLA